MTLAISDLVVTIGGVAVVRGLSLAVARGETLGIVGRNGAGKTTLLNVMARVIHPTAGRLRIRGPVSPMIDLMGGLHPELTGRENVFLNGSILGMRRSEIRARFDEIVAFAEIERFLDTPVKRYSSGMSVRLAFAVAAHLEPEILLVDEVLAVGDAAFQRKSLGKMNEVAEEGRTVIFVSHNLAILQALCQRGILLERGQVQADAPVAEAIDHYLRRLEKASSQDLLERADRDTSGYHDTMLKGLEIRDRVGGHTDAVVAGRPATITVEFTEVVPMMECQLTIVNSLGQPVTTFDSENSAPSDVRDGELGTRIECEVPSLPLLPGRYRIDVVIKGRRQVQDGLQGATFFDVEPGVVGERPMEATSTEGNVVLPHAWRLPA